MFARPGPCILAMEVWWVYVEEQWRLSSVRAENQLPWGIRRYFSLMLKHTRAVPIGLQNGRNWYMWIISHIYKYILIAIAFGVSVLFSTKRKQLIDCGCFGLNASLTRNISLLFTECILNHSIHLINGWHLSHFENHCTAFRALCNSRRIYIPFPWNDNCTTHTHTYAFDTIDAIVVFIYRQMVVQRAHEWHVFCSRTIICWCVFGFRVIHNK